MEVCPISVNMLIGRRKALPHNAGPVRLFGFWLEFNPPLFAEFDSSLVKVPPNTTLTVEPINT